jgi:Ni/Fe-hydrogenase subunit HybB-like protein
VFFLVSAIAGGITMVIFESSLSHRIFRHQIDPVDHSTFNDIILGLGKGAAAVLFTYFCLKWVGVAHHNTWHYLNTQLGYWFLLEIFGFVLAPCLILLWGSKRSSVTLVRIGAIWAVLGIILNRINVSMVALNWQRADRYVPSWTEIMITITVITLGLLVFRFIINRTPTLYRHPDYLNEPDH